MPNTLRDMMNLVSLLSDAGRTSMQQMIRELESLPPITLDAQIDTTQAVVPFAPEITVSATSSAVIDTSILLLDGQSGNQLLHFAMPTPAVGGVVAPFTLDVNGPYIFKVARTGIQSTGNVTLEKEFHVLAVQAAPPPPPPPPPSLVKPQISVKANGDGTFTVTGSGFVPGATVNIRVADEFLDPNVFFNTSADASGKVTGFNTPDICEKSGSLFFSANDGRTDKTDLTGTLWSNTVETTCS